MKPRSSRSSPLAFSALALVVALACACGRELGVQEVRFLLESDIHQPLPAGYNATAATVASGSVTANRTTGRGRIDVAGLPVPPLGFDYLAFVLFAPDELVGIPATTRNQLTAGGRRSSGLHTEHVGIHPDAGFDDAGRAAVVHPDIGWLDTIFVGSILAVNGKGQLDFDPDIAGGRSMAAVRGALVVLMPSGGTTPGEGIWILFGLVGLTGVTGEPAAGSEGGAHVHGP